MRGAFFGAEWLYVDQNLKKKIEDVGSYLSIDDLQYRTRPAAGEPAGALVLLHGRGADENDLFPLFDMLDPERTLLGVCPRGPLSLPPGGAHWYVVHRVGYPDPETFFSTFEKLTGWLEAFLDAHGLDIKDTLLGGFSQGAVMSYALTLGAGRERPAGLVAFSGFIPEVEGFDIDLGGLEGFPVVIGHGTHDPVISVEFGRSANRCLVDAGAGVVYEESPMPHTIDPSFIERIRPMIGSLIRSKS